MTQPESNTLNDNEIRSAVDACRALGCAYAVWRENLALANRRKDRASAGRCLRAMNRIRHLFRRYATEVRAELLNRQLARGAKVIRPVAA